MNQQVSNLLLGGIPYKINGKYDTGAGASDCSSETHPSSSSSEDSSSADSTSSADSPYTKKCSSHYSDHGMPPAPIVKPFHTLMSDKRSNSDSDGTYATVTVQESHTRNSFSSRISTNSYAKKFTAAENSHSGYQEFMTIHKKITGVRRN